MGRQRWSWTCDHWKGTVPFTPQTGTACSHTSPHRVQTVVPMADLVRQDPRAYVRSKNLVSVPIFFFRIDRGRNLSQGWRIFNGPDGYQYRWGPSPSNNGDIVVRKTFPRSFFSITQILPRSPPFRPLKQLQDPNGHIIARMQEVAPTKYNVGDVYRELHYIRSAGAGVVVSSVGPCCYLLAWARLPRDIQPLGALLPREG